MDIPTMPGISSQMVTTPRLTTRVLFAGPDDGTPVIFLHGNASDATYWEEIMLTLPAGFRGIAPDQRGYGLADNDVKIDATQGLGDLSDDVAALMDRMGIEKAHVVGHSAGGSVLWRFMMDHPGRILSVTVVNPSSPYGFGGTKDVKGTPTWPDFAGTGAGSVNAAFPPALANGDRSNEPGSPRNVMNSFYWKPPFVPAREEDLLSSMLRTHVGEQDYPGDMTTSENWPGIAPGKWGMINALTPKYLKPVSDLLSIEPKPPVLWVRGSHDQIVGDASMFEIGTLGQFGAIPGWPGAEVYPPQPMVAQTRDVLEQYAAAGGQYEEVVIEDTGHTPYIEKPGEFNTAFHRFIGG